jgi:HD-like signal output (HDOD) protein
VLSEPDSTLDQLVRVVGSEPALAARLLHMANSAALNPSGAPIRELRTALNLMGENMVRSASMAFAMAQIRGSAKLIAVKARLDVLWERSTLVAALAYVIAQTCTKINPDEAMLAGIMHGIGRLYVLTRAANFPELFGSEADLNGMLDDWHVEIGKTVLENWEFPEPIISAVAEQNILDRPGRRPPDLGDVLGAAVLMAAFASDPTGLQVALNNAPLAWRLGLDQAKTETINAGYAAEISALRQALLT